jgi:GT2 family glycosyltransferase
VTAPVESATVVVATRNRWPDLNVTLPRHRGPVIVVDNGSTDGTPQLVRRHFPHVDVVELASNHGATARNIGVERAQTPLVAFADDDSWWATGALALAAAAFDQSPRLALLAARMLVGPEMKLDPICEMMAEARLGHSPDLPGPSILGFLACGAVVRREPFLAAGGFDDIVFFMGEEERVALDLAALGWGLAYVDRVVAHHHPSRARNQLDREVRAARNRLLTATLRRPWPTVLTIAAHELRTGRVGRAAMREAIPLVPSALRQRRRLPRQVEAARRLLDEPLGPPTG